MSPTDRSVVSSVIKGVQWIGLGIMFQVTTRIGVLAVMARLVSPRDFGLIAIAYIFTSFAERLGQVGVGAAFVQRGVIDDDDLKTAAILTLVSGLAITGVLVSIAPLVAYGFDEPALRPILAALAVGFTIDSFGVLSDGLLQRELRFREIVKAETLSFLFGVVCIGIVLGWYGWGVWSLVGGNLASRASKAVLLRRLRPISLTGSWSTQRARSLLSIGIGFSFGKVLNFLSLQGDNFVVGRLLGAEALGMYTRAYQAMTLPAMYVGQAFERVLFPALSRKQDNPSALRRGLLGTLEVSTLVAAPVSVGMFLLSEEIVTVLFGDAWRAVIPVLTILSCGVFFRAAYKCSDVLIRSKGSVYAYAARQAWYTAIIVLGSVIGALGSGLTGVAWAVVLGVSVNYLLMTRLAGRLASVSTTDLIMSHVPGLWVAAWMGAALLAILPTLRNTCPTPCITLCVSSAIGCGVAGLAWFLSGPVSRTSSIHSLAIGFLRARISSFRCRRVEEL